MNLRLLLLPFSFLYGLVMRVRNFLYDKDIFSSYSPSLPVICIGNLSVGGTGKTPHTEYLIRLLKENHRIATLSRGYGRRTRGFRYVETNSPASACGDEPLQLKKKFGRDVIICVDEDREHGIRKIFHEHSDLDLIILDDAFQHRNVRAGLNILLSDYTTPYYKDHVLPAGNLREVKSGVRRADVVIITKCPAGLTEEEKKKIKALIPVQDVLFSTISYALPRQLSDDRELPFPGLLSGILMLSGIANNKPLKAFLGAQTRQLTCLEFPDHHDYTTADMDKLIAGFESMSEKNNIIVTSEKDAMRLKSPEIVKLISKLPVFYVPIHIEFSKDDRERFHQIIIRYVDKNKRGGGIH